MIYFVCGISLFTMTVIFKKKKIPEFCTPIAPTAVLGT